MECPKCGSKNVTYSHRRGIEKVLRFFYPSEPYRCKECWTRFWKAKSLSRTVLSAGIAVIISGAAVYYFVFMPGPQPVERKDSSSVNGKIPQARETAAKGSDIKEENILPQDKYPESSEEKKSPTPQDRASEPFEQEKGKKDSSPDQFPKSSEPQGKTDYKAYVPYDRSSEKQEKPKTADSGGPIRKRVGEPPPDSRDKERTVPSVPSAEKLPPLSDSQRTEETPLKVKGTAPRNVKKVLTRDTEEEFALILSADGPVGKYSHFALNPPPKLVLDIPGKWKYPGDTVLSVDSDTVSSIRVGVHSDMLRVVIDLAGKKTMVPEIEETRSGLRLIIKK